MTPRAPRIAPLIAICLLLAAASGQAAFGQAAEGSLDWYDSQAKDAISASNYEAAVKLLTEAKAKYPKSPEINLQLADLYYDKELFTLALDEYLQAEKKGSSDYHTLNQISRCYGKLGKDKESIGYLTRIISAYPDSVDAVDDLGWMYFKTNQLPKGEELILDGIGKFGMQRSLAMTLGTIYAGMNSYAKAREYYQKSIDDALSAGDRYFASIAYYNLSLLEENFFHFNSALAFTDESISMEDRASGHLARGELLETRMDYSGALDEYMKAYALDTTPLTKVNLAVLYQRFGQLELSRRYAEEALAVKDNAWILYYGTDIGRHYKDIHEILSDVYTGLSREESTRPTAGFFDRIGALFTSLWYRVKAWYHRQRFLQYSLAVGKDYLAEGRSEEADWELYKASEAYREVALSYLDRARAMETARTPHAEFYYLGERGKLLRSTEIIQKALEGYDAFWEKEAIAGDLASLIPLLTGGDKVQARRDALNRLYRINPGAFRQNGFGLPLQVTVEENAWGRGDYGRIVRYLKRTGSEVIPASPGGPAAGAAGAQGVEFGLSLRLEKNGAARFALTELASGRVISSESMELSGSRAARCAALAKGILDAVYKLR